jgi:CelD/BcsL family acetyltransferase involved in cellulose biosynthesis
VVPLPETIPMWRGNLPGGLHRNIRRYGQRLAAAGAVMRTIGEVGELEAALDALLRLHTARWRDRQSPGIFADPEVRRFHRLSAPALLTRNLLQLHVVETGAETIAVQYVMVSGGRAYSYIGGFDPAWNHFSLGTLLMAYSIERAIECGCREFDLLKGTEEYKYTWGAVDRPTLSCTRCRLADAE